MDSRPSVSSRLSSDAISRLIAGGESSTLEFKSSIRYDYQTRNVNRELIKVIAKAAAGFLNSDGGQLLVGVSDDGAVLGIQPDIDTLSRKTRDAFEMALRNGVAGYLGVEVTPRLAVTFTELDGLTIVCITCPASDSAVYMRDGERQEFYVRDGNQTRPLDVRAAHVYIRMRWPEVPSLSDDAVRRMLNDSLREQIRPMLQELFGAAVEQVLHEPAPHPPVVAREMPPDWIRIATRRVLNLFLGPLATSPGWRRLYLISPWLSDIEHSANMTSDQFAKRLRDDGATAYVVTRPPVEEWHKQALDRLAKTNRVNVALVPGLHVKLFCALTSRGSFAMLGSANFTQQAQLNREIGLLVTSYGDGERLVRELNHEAANIYRLPERRLLYQASFRPN